VEYSVLGVADAPAEVVPTSEDSMVAILGAMMVVELD